MDLLTNSDYNLLPCDGEVFYLGKILGSLESERFLQKLLDEIEWCNDKAVFFGKEITTKRKFAWYGDEEFDYSYSKVVRKALDWNKTLLELKKLVEEMSGETFNSCLLNLYHDGSEGMGWHNDSEKELKENGAIGSLSLGAERKFLFKHKKLDKRVNLNLENASLLIMKGVTQSNWLHSLPKSKKVRDIRVNLTFRTIVR